MRLGLEIYLKQRHWGFAARLATNLSELELTLGEMTGAMGDAKQSVVYAERSGVGFLRGLTRETHADALHQVGRRGEAETRFDEAEKLQAERQPHFPLLYSTGGFRYCELLLANAERTAWQFCLDSSFVPHPSSLPTACNPVEQRATKTLKWAEESDASLLTIALDHLTLGRALLYRSILNRTPLATSHSSLEKAVDGLRRAGTQHHLPRSLLTRAWCFFTAAMQQRLHGDDSKVGSFVTKARSDLDEAWEIVERGSMKLHMADIHLYRARLFGIMKDRDKDEVGIMKDEISYPWDSPQVDLDEAARLIEETGYHRRDEELADAREALGV